MRRLWNAALTHSPHQPKLASGHTHKRPGERVFFIAPLAAKPRPENAFVYDELASGATYLESDPIGLAGGSFSTYSYVANNPLWCADPTGTGPVGGVIGGTIGGILGGLVGAETGPGDQPSRVDEPSGGRSAARLKILAGLTSARRVLLTRRAQLATLVHTPTIISTKRWDEF